MSATMASLVCWVPGSTVGGASLKSTSTPFGNPASARSFLARSVSCLYGLRLASQPKAIGFTAVATRSPSPFSTCLMMASWSAARFAATRTRLSVKGFGPPLAAESNSMKAVRRIGEVDVRAAPDLLMTSIWSGGTALITSTPPESSSAIWVACSGMMRTRTYL